MPSTPPEIVTLESNDPYGVLIRMAPPVRPNGRITAYTFYIAFDNETVTTQVDLSGFGILTLGGLYPYQLVMVRVSANTSVGEGPRSAWDEVRTQPSGNFNFTLNVNLDCIRVSLCVFLMPFSSRSSDRCAG